MNKIFVVLSSAILAMAAAAATEAPSRRVSLTRSATHDAATALPDWSGAWIIPEADFVVAIRRELNPSDPSAPLLQPKAAARLAARYGQLTSSGRSDLEAKLPKRNAERCLPAGMPDVMRYPVAIEFLFTPGRVTMLTEESPGVRRIYTDGRSHDPNADPTYMGESIGHWEGSALVIDTLAIVSKAELIGGVTTSGQAHVIERVSLKDKNHLQIDTIVDDPDVLRQPWRYTRTYERLTSGFVESICLENNRDAGSEPDLTPPQ